MTNINAFYILQGTYIDAARDEILKKYGSIDAYLADGLGLTERDVQKLRDRLLE
jgi:protein-tyrosine phosphatase